jgi:hypothetical protein
LAAIVESAGVIRTDLIKRSSFSNVQLRGGGYGFPDAQLRIGENDGRYAGSHRPRHRN